jgi:hypothetical protein
MGFIDKAMSAVGDKITGAAGGEKTPIVKDAFPQGLWKIDGKDWYKVYAYQFTVSSPAGNTVTPTSAFRDLKKQLLSKITGEDPEIEFEPKYFFTLPIPPQSLVIKPVIASKATATVGGVVEETSPTTFWMIQMSGTTGTGIGRTRDDQHDRKKLASDFRNTITTGGLLSDISAGINQAIGKFIKPADGFLSGVDAALEGDLGGAASGVVGAINDQLVPPLPFNSSGVPGKSNGYREIQELSKFIHSYQKLKSDNPAGFTLQFAIHKTNQVWDVVVKNFEIQQNAQQPHLYRYNITLQGWNVRSLSSVIGGSDRTEIDRFSGSGDLRPKNNVPVADIGAKLGFNRVKTAAKSQGLTK